MPGPRVVVETFGCRVNQYDSYAMQDRLKTTCEITDQAPDIVILNACTVTALAERKARQAARRSRRLYPGAVIILIGCLADAVAQGTTRFLEADVLAGNSWKARIDDVVRRAWAGERGLLKARPFAQLSEEASSGPPRRVRAFLKIQDGCSRSCTYCRTTQVRGPTRSKSIARVVAEAQALVDRGFPEIVLTGIDLAQYAPPIGRLSDVVSAMASIDGLQRLRLASVNPSGITTDLLDACAVHPTVCPHFHVPLQSGDDRILSAMARDYDKSTYLETIQRIRDRIPSATLGTDLIVGFPGEDDASFEHTCDIVEAVGYVNVHVFRFSARQGTAAARMANQVSGDIKRDRAARLMERWDETLNRVLDNRIGSTQHVLVEEHRGNVLHGYTNDYLHTTFGANRRIPVGSIVPVRITGREHAAMRGVSDHRIDAR